MIPGETTTQVNVRAGPGTTYESLGLLGQGAALQVTLKSGDGLWYRILYPPAGDGFGWVAAAYVRLPEGSEVPGEATPLPDGPTGSVLQRLNVRSGPATSFESLGLLETGTIVVLTARNTTGAWFQIEYPAGPGGRGWVTAQYILTSMSEDLPVLDDFGQPLSTGTPGEGLPAASPTPTPAPAPEDGDSSASPAVSIIFASGGTRTFTYSSQVSAPDGDANDWVEFTPFASLPGAQARLRISLSCQGSGGLLIELWQGGIPLADWGALACGASGQSLLLTPGVAYQLRLSAQPGDGLRSVAYRLTLENLP
jgi:uncharacterized protein YraI